jgi:hypothetical protein
MEQNLPTTEFSLCASWNKSDVNLNKSVACYSAVLLQLVREPLIGAAKFFGMSKRAILFRPSSAARLPAGRQVMQKGRAINKIENGRRYRLAIG